MRRLAKLVAVSMAAGLMSCGLFQHDVNISLNPTATFTIQSTGTSTTGQTQTPLSISPSIAGSDYTGNKSKIDSAKLDSITFTISNVYPDDLATVLDSGSVTLTNTTSGQTETFTLSGPIHIAAGSANKFTSFSPDPSGFLSTILKSGDSFTVAATGTVDAVPVHVDVQVDFAVTLTVNLL